MRQTIPTPAMAQVSQAEDGLPMSSDLTMLDKHSEHTQTVITTTQTSDGYAVPRSGSRWSFREAK